MKFEAISGITIPKIGLGSWGFGNQRSKDPISLNALYYALKTGYTHFDTAEIYASGHSEELIGQAVRETNTKRENVFITTKISPEHLGYNDVFKSCENSLRRLKMDYVDLYLIHWPRIDMKLEETFRALNKLVRDGKVKHLGVSNFNLKLLKQSQKLSESTIITNQVPYSVSNRGYVKNGVLEYCQQNNILFTSYSPVDEGNLRSNKTLESIAEAHNATIFQIALAWVISQPRVITIPMSFNPQHIKENFDAAEIELTQNEIEQLTNG